MNLLRPEIAPVELELNCNQTATDVLHGYSVELDNQRYETHPLRVVDIVKDFAFTLLPAAAYDAVLLHDLPDRLHKQDTSDVARATLSEYFNSMSTEEGLYVSCLLADMEVVENAAETYRTGAVEDDTDFIDAIKGSYEEDLPEKYWMKESSVCEPNIIKDLLQEVNLESVLIKAAELLDNITFPPPREAALLQDIHEAESFYAPLCEVLGFDGLAMALRDTASSIRLEKSGNSDFLTAALEAIDPLHFDVDAYRVLDKIFGSNSHIMEKVVADRSESHSVNIGDVVIDINEAHFAGTWRIKSVGSTAMKLCRQNNKLPMDIVGLTLIANDTTEAAEVFKSIMSIVKNSKDISMQAAPSKEKAASVRGDRAYVDQFVDVLDDLDSVQEIVNDFVGFRVAKVTFEVEDEVMGNVPTEIQVVTKRDRKNNRIGNTSHYGYKAGEIVDPEALESIYDRKARLNPGTLEVNGQSIARAKKLLNDCSASER